MKPTKQFHVLALPGFALVLLFLLDATLFRTGLYRRVIEPQSYAGQTELALQQCAAAPPSTNNVLVLGDSRIAEGFSSRVADQEAGGAARFINGSVHGSTLRCWYYILRKADPQAKAFQTIVLPLDDYQDEDGIWDWADRILDLRIVVFCLRVQDTREFASSFHAGSARFDALRGSTFNGFELKDDVQDFLLHPVARIRKARQWAASGVEWLNSYTGNPSSLAGLSVDWSAAALHFPPGVPANVQGDLRTAAFRQPLPQTGAYRKYRLLWFGKILARYKGTPTRLLIVRVPRGPIVPPRANHFTTAITELHAPELAIAEEQQFAPLEKPEYFFDSLHLNAAGRLEFSKRLARLVTGR